MITVRPYRREELPAIVGRGVETAIASLVQRDLPAGSHEAVQTQLVRMYQNALLVPDTTILVATWPAGVPGAGLAGYTLLMPQPNAFTGERELVVMDIWTHPHLRGRGVGKALLEHAAAYARTVRCPSLTAQIALHNQASLSLFRAAGYAGERVVVGRRL
ncbi:MAG TPA: GNAT family N-acetyltransferase [Symbiobacteriaceae bacterium]|nr:GNAT family N-acetyltransferase [Symbiobacteriaceae bacterium]